MLETSTPDVIDANLWIVLPAAGIGSRMATCKPKQYLELEGHSLISRTVVRLKSVFTRAQCVIALAQGDPWWPQLPALLRQSVHTCIGGQQRGESVWHGLTKACQLGASNEDWVLVHDAVRPLVPLEDLKSLWQEANSRNCSAVLGAPVVDSLRRVDHDGGIVDIVPRESVWRMFTPQLFRVSILKEALADPSVRRVCSDESQAVINLGEKVFMVRGSDQNIKITYPGDLKTAASILACQRNDSHLHGE